MPAKNYKIFIANSVKTELEKQVDYIAFEQQEPEIAARWLDGIIAAIQSLSYFPDRHAIAPENFYINKNDENVIRHFIYKKSFRVIFSVVRNEVRVLSVRHGARDLDN